jgi:pyridoxamine 5'-phosphate oxidase
VDTDELTRLRQALMVAGLDEADLAADPVTQFRAWYAEWSAVAVGEPDAMVVASATPDGRPSARTVLLRSVDDGGFTFFSNYDSRKGVELAANPRTALLFSWHPIGRQVIVEGAAARTDAAASDAYWATRPRGSQIAGAASPQSRVVPDRAALERAWAALEATYAGRDVPRPAHWGGIRVVPDRVEFWQQGESRRHDRLVYRRDPAARSGWSIERLAP